MRLLRHHPEPGRFWIAASPSTWSAAQGPWTHVAAGRLLGAQGRPPAALPKPGQVEIDDLFYLPPAHPLLAGERDLVARELSSAGTPVLVQLAPGEEAPEMPDRGAPVTRLYDLAEPLLSGELDILGTLPAGVDTVWPLVASVTDGAEICERGCELLAAAGVRSVQPLAVDIEPVTRRGLAEERDDEQVFAALFHGPPPSERDFARVAHAHGLAVFMTRPETGYSARRIGNRRLAAGLALAGELWLRLGRQESRGQALLRGARGADAAIYDLTALVREGNLTVMDWIDEIGAEILGELVSEGRSPRLEALISEYLQDEVA